MWAQPENKLQNRLIIVALSRRIATSKVQAAIELFGELFGVNQRRSAFARVGKSTLLKAILGLVREQSGRIERADTLHFGYVPQLQTLDELFPVTVGEVVMMGRYGRIGAARRPKSEDFGQLQRALDAVGIAELASRLYRDLSGGQKQRALIARALVGEPDILVLDEHTNDLDIGGERAIMELLETLHLERQFAVVMVSHSLNTVANHARTLGLIRDGRCTFAPIETALNAEFLSEFYNVPLQVLESEGRRVVA